MVMLNSLSKVTLTHNNSPRVRHRHGAVTGCVASAGLVRRRRDAWRLVGVPEVMPLFTNRAYSDGLPSTIVTTARYVVTVSQPTHP